MDESELTIKKTKSRILEAAQKLFFSKGYNETSINDIIGLLRLSKGAFYHHFNTKEELLDALTDAVTDQIMREVSGINRENIDAIAKLNKFFSISRQFKSTNLEIMRVYIDALYKPSNLTLLDKMRRRSFQKAAPALLEILNQGIKEGTFDMKDTEHVAAVAWDIMFGMSRVNADFLMDKETDKNWNKLERMNNAYERALERLFGCSEGSIKAVDRQFIDDIKDLLLSKEGKT